MSARLEPDCRLRLAGLAVWLVVATTIVAGFTTGPDWPVAVGALVAAMVAALVVPSPKLGLGIGLLAGLLGAGWLLLDGNAAVTALGIGSSICLSALTALLVSLTHASSPAPSADRPGRPASAATRLPPGVADETLLERLTVHEMTRARRYERPLTLLLVGVEGWSTICAERGRRSAHELLGTLAIRIRRLLRDVDAIGLHGDGRLAILLPETPLDGALVVAGRIERMATDDVGLKVRLGASLFPEDAVTVEGLIREADAALDLARLEQVSVAERVRLA